MTNEPASTNVNGHGHGFRLGVDQPDYARLLRCFASFARDALHASVTRRAASYESHPSWVSIQPRSRRQRRRIPAHVESISGAEPSTRFGSGASPRMPWKTVRRCPSGMCRLACRTGVSASPCLDADGPLAGKSTGRKHPIVRRCSRMFNTVRQPEEVVASGAKKTPPAERLAARLGVHLAESTGRGLPLPMRKRLAEAGGVRPGAPPGIIAETGPFLRPPIGFRPSNRAGVFAPSGMGGYLPRF